YTVLLKEFQGDKIVKDEAKQIVIGKIRREESAAGPSGANPTESRNDIQEDDSITSKEVLITDTGVESVSEPLESTREEPIAEKEKEEGSSPLKVVGKIDLDSLKRGKPKKASQKEEVVREVRWRTAWPEVRSIEQETKRREVKPVVGQSKAQVTPQEVKSK